MQLLLKLVPGGRARVDWLLAQVDPRLGPPAPSQRVRLRSGRQGTAARREVLAVPPEESEETRAPMRHAEERQDQPDRWIGMPAHGRQAVSGANTVWG